MVFVYHFGLQGQDTIHLRKKKKERHLTLAVRQPYDKF